MKGSSSADIVGCISISQAALRSWNITHIRLERKDDAMRVIEPLGL